MRRGRNQPELPLERPVRVKLTDDDRARKGHELAVKRQAVRVAKRQLKTASKNAKDEIARLEGEMDEISDDLVADEEIRKQGDLRYDGKADATPVLAAVAAVADGKAPPPPNVAHTFVADKSGEGKCFAGCGKPKDDPLHASPSEAHVFVPTGANGTAQHMCKVCGAGASDPVHVSERTIEPKSPTAKVKAPAGKAAQP